MIDKSTQKSNSWGDISKIWGTYDYPLNVFLIMEMETSFCINFFLLLELFRGEILMIKITLNGGCCWTSEIFKKEWGGGGGGMGWDGIWWNGSFYWWSHNKISLILSRGKYEKNIMLCILLVIKMCKWLINFLFFLSDTKIKNTAHCCPH